MVETIQKIASSAIGTAETIYQHNTASSIAIIKIIWITNTTNVDATLSLWNPTGGVTCTDDNQLMDTVTIPAYDFVQINTYIPLTGAASNADSIVGTATASNAITVSLYGAKIT